MSRAALQATIDAAWEDWDKIGLATTGPVRDAVEAALELLDGGAAWVAENGSGRRDGDDHGLDAHPFRLVIRRRR